MFRGHELLGRGLEQIVLKSRVDGRAIKIPRLDWYFAQHLLGLNAEERTEEDIALYHKYFDGHILNTSLRTTKSMRIPGTEHYLFPNRQIVVQEEMSGYHPLRGTVANLDRYRSQLEEIARQNRLMYEETGFTLDLVSSEYLFPTIINFLKDPNFWAMPNLFVKDDEVRISDYGLFQIKDPHNPIDAMANLVLRTFTRNMGNRIGIDFLPKE